MYTKYFRLSNSPFALTADPRFLLFTSRHREVLAGLAYAVGARKGLVVLTGGAGTGKTTMLRKLLQTLDPNTVQSSFIINPLLTSDELLEMALFDFGSTDIPSSKTQRIVALNRLLLEAASQGKTSILIIDEAHKLSSEVLEEVRLLSNVEKADEKLLQIVLAGQTELGDVLNRVDLRQLKQRIALRLRTERLSATEVEMYVRHRWAKAGGVETVPFESAALACIASSSEGVPRLINVICDNSLLLAFSEDKKVVTASHVREVCTDLDLPTTQKLQEAPGQIDGSAASELAVKAKAEQQPDSNVQGLAGTALLRRLERYEEHPHDRSFVTRWAGRLGFAHRTN
jgi:general secretion pathway protein A